MMKNRFHVLFIKYGLLLTLAFALISANIWADSLPRARPEEVGLSPQRLERITKVLSKDVEQGRVPGLVALLARHGKIAYFESFGMRDKSLNSPMKKDAIFRIYSMSKPIVSVAAMMLVESGKISLEDPVAKYLPEFEDMKVGVEKRNKETGQKTLILVPAQRQMTIKDLLRHTSGLTYAFFGRSMVTRLYRKAGVYKNNQTPGSATIPAKFNRDSRFTEFISV